MDAFCTKCHIYTCKGSNFSVVLMGCGTSEGPAFFCKIFPTTAEPDYVSLFYAATHILCDELAQPQRILLKHIALKVQTVKRALGHRQWLTARSSTGCQISLLANITRFILMPQQTVLSSAPCVLLSIGLHLAGLSTHFTTVGLARLTCIHFNVRSLCDGKLLKRPLLR